VATDGEKLGSFYSGTGGAQGPWGGLYDQAGGIGISESQNYIFNRLPGRPEVHDNWVPGKG